MVFHELFKESKHIRIVDLFNLYLLIIIFCSCVFELCGKIQTVKPKLQALWAAFTHRGHNMLHLHFHPFLTSLIYIFPVQSFLVLMYCIVHCTSSVLQCVPWAGSRCLRRTWHPARAVLLSTTASGSCLITNITFMTLLVSGERWGAFIKSYSHCPDNSKSLQPLERCDYILRYL